MAKHTAKWLARPEKDDLAAALQYLSLQFTRATAKRIVLRAQSARCINHVAKDLLRACNLPLLPDDDIHVAADLKRIHKGKPLSPIVLVQGDLTRGRPLVIADGYHRLCAACHADEDAPVAAVMVQP